jgi:hypothetical protein
MNTFFFVSNLKNPRSASHLVQFPLNVGPPELQFGLVKVFGVDSNDFAHPAAVFVSAQSDEQSQ